PHDQQISKLSSTSAEHLRQVHMAGSVVRGPWSVVRGRPRSQSSIMQRMFITSGFFRPPANDGPPAQRCKDGSCRSCLRSEASLYLRANVSVGQSVPVGYTMDYPSSFLMTGPVRARGRNGGFA